MALRTCSFRLELFARRRPTCIMHGSSSVSPPSVCKEGWVGDASRQTSIQPRWLSTSENPPSSDTDRTDKGVPRVLYEGPFASLSVRLKRVSVTTAAIGLVGMPLLMYFHGGDVPASGQLAVGGTAIFAATGSTIALSYCFSPYVHTLERVVVEEDRKGDGEEGTSDAATSATRDLVKATTANILSMKVETVFDPAADVTKPSVHRPFCNFVAAGVPMYVHPEMIYDENLRLQLVGEAEADAHKKAMEAAKEQDKDDTIL